MCVCVLIYLEKCSLIVSCLTSRCLFRADYHVGWVVSRMHNFHFTDPTKTAFHVKMNLKTRITLGAAEHAENQIKQRRKKFCQQCDRTVCIFSKKDEHQRNRETKNDMNGWRKCSSNTQTNKYSLIKLYSFCYEENWSANTTENKCARNSPNAHSHDHMPQHRGILKCILTFVWHNEHWTLFVIQLATDRFMWKHRWMLRNSSN